MIIENLSKKINFTQTELQVINYIEKYPRIVINLSLEELSQECFVSQASIIRLCKKIGAKGYSDFKIQLASELSLFALDHEKISVDAPMKPNSSTKEIAEIFFNLSHQALEQSFNEINFSDIEKAASLLTNAHTIRIYGRGESLILAEDFHYKLIRLGINSVLETLNGFQEAKSGSQKSDEVALVISQYCNSRQTAYIIDELKSNRIPFILVTATQKTWPYDLYAEATLRIFSNESRYKIGSFSSRTAMLYLLDCLYGRIFVNNYDHNVETLARNSKLKAERDYFYRSINDI